MEVLILILPKVRDSRFTTFRRGGLLSDINHHSLAIWAARCAEHVLHFFEDECPNDARPRKAIEATYNWVNGNISMKDARIVSFHANAAASQLKGATRFAAYAAGQSAVVAHVAAHYLGASAYALKATRVVGDNRTDRSLDKEEWDWQMSILPDELRELVLEDQRNRNAICWNVFYA